jgi:hypothetical protein
VLRSPDVVLAGSDVAPAWRGELARDLAKNVVPSAGAVARASSTWKEQRAGSSHEHAASFAIDGRIGTSWIADPADRQPRLEIELTRPTIARAILVTNAVSRPYRVGAFARALEIEITIDGNAHRLRMPYDELNKGRLELPGATSIRRISLQVVWSVPGELQDCVGIAEVELQDE